VPNPQSVPMSTGLRIAIADDERDMRNLFQRMLSRCGHQVVSVAENGRQLVEQCQRLRPDLVISDVQMPELDGVAAALQIVRDRPTPVILVSAQFDPDFVERPENQHVMVYLGKPVGRADLEPAITTALERFDQRQANGESIQDQPVASVRTNLKIAANRQHPSDV
jgi:two-component system, response regulator PdtaR